MSLKLIFGSALTGMETVLNNALALDPASKKKLIKLSGKTIAVAVSSPSLSLFITITERGFLLSPIQTAEADSEITGSATSLLPLLISRDKTKIIRTNSVQLKGDISVIQDFQNLLTDLNIDWEYQLSKFIGDVPTQGLSNGLKFIADFISKSSASLKNDLDEYIHEEINLLPGTTEMERFYQRIDTLRLSLDRNQARVNKIANDL